MVFFSSRFSGLAVVSALTLFSTAVFAKGPAENFEPPKDGQIVHPRYFQITCDTDGQVRDIAKAAAKKEDEEGVGPMGRRVAYYKNLLNDHQNSVCDTSDIGGGVIKGDPVHLGDLYNACGVKFDGYLTHVIVEGDPTAYPVLWAEHFFEDSREACKKIPQKS